MRSLLGLLALSLSLVALAGCPASRASSQASPAPETKDAGLAASASVAPTAPEVPPPPPVVAGTYQVDVAGDFPAFMVPRADRKAPRVVFLAGLCSQAQAYVQELQPVAFAGEGMLGVQGDTPCSGAFRSYSWSAAKQHARVEAALAAADAKADGEALTLIGYSQGATLAEQMAEKWPARYPRLILIGAPVDPSATRLKKTGAVVMMACSKDVTSRMREGARRLAASGVPSTYMEMPGCTHGWLADSTRIFTEALAWLREHERVQPL